MKKKRKKRKRALYKFLYVFLNSILIILALSITGFASYKFTLLYYDKFGMPKKNDKIANAISEMYGEVTVTDISKNLIYAVGDDNKLKAVVLEIFNTNTDNMDYITIPLKTQFTLSNELYQKICASGCDIPQIMKLSHLIKYFSDKSMYEYGVILIEDLLDVDIDYYTAMPVEEFKSMFKQGDAPIAYANDGTEMQSYYEWHLKHSFIKKLSVSDEKEIETYFKDLMHSCKSNLNIKSKLEYVKEYKNIHPNLIYEHSLFGSLKNDDFEINVDESNRLIKTILENDTYTKEQKEGTSVSQKGSIGRTIQISNASEIDGLAAKYQTILTNAGYTIASIGNYTGEKASQTKILVKDEEIGADLLSYFTNGVVEKAELPYGCDIQIVLGTDAKMDTSDY